MLRSRSWRVSPVLIALAALAPLFPLHAQAGSTSAPTSALQWSATLRTRAEGWDWFDAGPEGRYAFVGTYLRAGISQQQRGFGWRVELMAPVLLGLPDDAVLPAPQGQLGQGGSYFAAN